MLKLHDTCGVNNLHGVPGIISGIISILACYFADESIYGPSLYLLFPQSAPEAGSDRLSELQRQLPQIEAGQGRTMTTQALIQLACILITLTSALVGGLLTGEFYKRKRKLLTVYFHQASFLTSRVYFIPCESLSSTTTNFFGTFPRTSRTTTRTRRRRAWRPPSLTFQWPEFIHKGNKVIERLSLWRHRLRVRVFW